MITKLMHGTHVAQHASEAWLDQLRNGNPQFAVNDAGERVEIARMVVRFQCLGPGCNRILGSDDVTDGETYEEGAE